MRVELVTLLDDPLCAVLPESHLLAAREQIGLEELASETWVDTPSGTDARRLLLSACARAGFIPRVAFESDEYLTIQQLVAAGVGRRARPRAGAALLLGARDRRRAARHTGRAPRDGRRAPARVPRAGGGGDARDPGRGGGRWLQRTVRRERPVRGARGRATPAGRRGSPCSSNGPAIRSADEQRGAVGGAARDGLEISVAARAAAVVPDRSSSGANGSTSESVGNARRLALDARERDTGRPRPPPARPPAQPPAHSVSRGAFDLRSEIVWMPSSCARTWVMPTALES